MWPTVNRYYRGPRTEFITASKLKGTQQVKLSWPLGPSLERAALLLLDPVIASGDTVLAICREAERRSIGDRSITVLSCYASPEAVSRLLNETADTRIVVAALAETVLPSGWLVPPTHGDMGDKLFRSVEQ